MLPASTPPRAFAAIALNRVRTTLRRVSRRAPKPLPPAFRPALLLFVLPFLLFVLVLALALRTASPVPSTAAAHPPNRPSVPSFLLPAARRDRHRPHPNAAPNRSSASLAPSSSLRAHSSLLRQLLFLPLTQLSSSSSNQQQQQQQQQPQQRQQYDPPFRFHAPATFHALNLNLSAVNAARAHWTAPRPSRAPNATADVPSPAAALEDGFWSLVKDDVVIGVKTGHEVAAVRLAALRRHGWWSLGRDVPNMLVVGDTDNATLGVVGLKHYGESLLARFAAPSAATHSNDDDDDDDNRHQERRRRRRRRPRTGASDDGSESANEAERNSEHDTRARRARPKQWFASGGWKGDKDKNLPALHLMRTVFPNKKWYLLLDDDTYVLLDNLARFLLQDGMDDGGAVYTGKVFYISRCSGFGRDGTWAPGSHGRSGSGSNAAAGGGGGASPPAGSVSSSGGKWRGVFAHGGSGIVVNGRAMDAMYASVAGCMRDLASCWAGDMQVSLCLSRVGVGLRRVGGDAGGPSARFGFERHFIPFRPSKALADKRYAARWHSDAEPITFHKLPLKETRVLAQAERAAAAQGDNVVYRSLLKHLLGAGVLPAHTPRDRANRYFSDEFLPPNLRSAHRANDHAKHS